MMDKNSKIFVAGSRGMVGSAIVRKLKSEGYTNIIETTSKELDLREQNQVRSFFEKEKPEYVFLAAAKVGGIQANIDNPAIFLYDNLMIQNNIIHQSYLNGVKKLMFFGSSCIFPRDCPQPMKEEYILTGKFEPTNEGYAVSKIAGLKMCEYYKKQYGFNAISVMPCNLYGPNDSFDPHNSHVLSALVKKMVDAKEQNLPFVTVWGDGSARRELMYVDDCAEACIHIFLNYEGIDFINIGTGKDISIKELSFMIANEVGFEGTILFDDTKPNGMPRKVLDTTRLNFLGYRHKTSLIEGVKKMIDIYRTNYYYV